VTGGWRKLDTEELLVFYSLHSIVRVIKRRKTQFLARLSRICEMSKVAKSGVLDIVGHQ
jgi:hypothetical protein